MAMVGGSAWGDGRKSVESDISILACRFGGFWALEPLV